MDSPPVAAPAVAAPAVAGGGPDAGLHRFDPLDVESALERCMWDVKMLEKVLGKFEEHLPDTVRQLRVAVEEGEAKSVVRLAHAIKGAAANASAVKLQTLAAEMEQHAEFASLEKLRRQAESLAEEIKRCLAFVPSAKAKARACTRGSGAGGGMELDLNALMRR
jgi:HPt (histidine-containing phosphotransfer) domain-containing protein